MGGSVARGRAALEARRGVLRRLWTRLQKVEAHADRDDCRQRLR